MSPATLRLHEQVHGLLILLARLYKEWIEEEKAAAKKAG